MGGVTFRSPNMPAAHVLCYMFVLYCKIEQIPARCVWGGVAAKRRMSSLAFCFSRWIVSASGPRGQKHVLVLQSERACRIRPTEPRPRLDSSFPWKQGDGSEVNPVKQLSLCLGLLPEQTGHSALFPKTSSRFSLRPHWPAAIINKCSSKLPSGGCLHPQGRQRTFRTATVKHVTHRVGL